MVGRTFVWTWETGAPGAVFEVSFISDNHHTSKGVAGPVLGYSDTHIYDFAIVAPDVYMISWLKPSGITVTVVLNLTEKRIYGAYSNPVPERGFMTGTIREITV